MDTKKIALLMDVVKIGSLKRAAEALNYTQSGLIYQINSLEQEIGVPLLVRNHKGVSLTQAGKTLEPLFQNLIDNSARLRMEVEAFTQKRGNEIRLGAVPSALSGQFSAVTNAALVRLVSWLCRETGLSPEAVIRHYDVSGKECPRYHVRCPEAWDALLDEIRAAL